MLELNKGRINMSVNAEGSVVVVEDASSSQGESVIHVVRADKREVPPNFLDFPVKKMERSAEEARLANPESKRNENVCVAATVVVDASKAGDALPMLREGQSITAYEAEEYVDLVWSSSPVRGGMEPEGSPSESVSNVFPRNTGGFLDTAGLPLCKFSFQPVFTLLEFFLSNSHICLSVFHFQANYIREHFILKMAF